MNIFIFYIFSYFLKTEFNRKFGRDCTILTYTPDQQVAVIHLKVVHPHIETSRRIKKQLFFWCFIQNYDLWL